jgi:hypothetical protein
LTRPLKSENNRFSLLVSCGFVCTGFCPCAAERVSAKDNVSENANAPNNSKATLEMDFLVFIITKICKLNASAMFSLDG